MVLGDGFTLDVKGLYIPQGSTLEIYSQSDGENAGRIRSHPSGGAAIGGYSENDNGDIVIHGGNIEARGADHCAGIGSNDGNTGGSITIYGGSDGAAIGGRRNSSGGTTNAYSVNQGQGGVIRVSDDLTASGSDSVLSVPAGVTVEVDLQGHTLDASLLQTQSDDSACLAVQGDFTLLDTVGGGGFICNNEQFTDIIAVRPGGAFVLFRGAVTGIGSALKDVVYIDSSGSFAMNGGTVSGSGGKADVFTEDGSIWLNGGTLAGTDLEYGNVYAVDSDDGVSGQIAVSGSPCLDMGVYLTAGRRIDVTGPLGDNASIPVIPETLPTLSTPVIVTNGLEQGGTNAVHCFTCDIDNVWVVRGKSGEVELQELTDWRVLQHLIDVTENGGILTLEKNYTAADCDIALEIKSEKV